MQRFLIDPRIAGQIPNEIVQVRKVQFTLGIVPSGCDWIPEARPRGGPSQLEQR